MTAEIEIQNAIRRELGKQGHYVFRSNVGKILLPGGRIFDTGLPKGFPDLFGFRKSDGKIFFIEVKNEKGKLRPEQVKFQDAMSKQRVLCGVARSVDDAIRIVEGMERWE
ncbi:VRR-NUC domain-containing protein [Listeria booriae]|uniref:VRR-NUC domain-containing protein n=1 Tax=Listeria booriae TaxID=1552123 RepID=A0A7X1A3H9_9LIST|nr:VRR-NUC domain-containing protein [Listeria booriae]MBC2370550.1 VRR-NUC domain-containing protein [Listeria booriae]